MADRAFESLWDFSLEFYSDTSCRDKLLFLQNQYGLNVCVLLWILWLARYCFALRLDVFTAGLSRANAIESSLLAPLRLARQNLKSPSFENISNAQDIKNDILNAELNIEKNLLNELGGRDFVEQNSVTGDGAAKVYFAEALMNEYIRHKEIEVTHSMTNVVTELFTHVLDRSGSPSISRDIK